MSLKSDQLEILFSVFTFEEGNTHQGLCPLPQALDDLLQKRSMGDGLDPC